MLISLTFLGRLCCVFLDDWLHCRTLLFALSCKIHQNPTYLLLAKDFQGRLSTALAFVSELRQHSIAVCRPPLVAAVYQPPCQIANIRLDGISVMSHCFFFSDTHLWSDKDHKKSKMSSPSGKSGEETWMQMATNQQQMEPQVVFQQPTQLCPSKSNSLSAGSFFNLWQQSVTVHFCSCRTSPNPLPRSRCEGKTLSGKCWRGSVAQQTSKATSLALPDRYTGSSAPHQHQNWS